jgi:hypothetical protein
VVPLELEEPLDELLEPLDELEPLELPELLDEPEPLELLELLPEELEELLEPKPGVPLGPQAERVSNRKVTGRQFLSFMCAARLFKKNAI